MNTRFKTLIVVEVLVMNQDQAFGPSLLSETVFASLSAGPWSDECVSHQEYDNKLRNSFCASTLLF